MTQSPDETDTPAQPSRQGGSGCRLFAIVFFAVLLALLVGALVLRFWLFPAPHDPVALSPVEKQMVNAKLSTIGAEPFPGADNASPSLEPQPYSEAGAKREIVLSERELNGLLAKNTDLARKLAIDLADGLASARLVLPLDPDFPFLGGQTLRASAGVAVGFEQSRPVLRLRGVSLWGVPLPNAWLGNLKNVDLIANYGDQPGFWQSFAAGVEALSVREGELRIQLKE